MKRIYCLSGLGADERVFAKLQLHCIELVHLQWLPFEKEDTLTSYALKMGNLIAEDAPVIMGLSFGGMLAAEMTRHLNPKMVIVVSSAKSAEELPRIGSIPKWIVRRELIPAIFIRTLILY